MRFNWVPAGNPQMALAVAGLILAAGLAPAGQGTEFGADAAGVPADGAALAPQGLRALAQKPWVKRLMAMWHEEEPEVVDGESLDPRSERFLSLVERGNLFHVFRQGGPIMYPLCGASMLAVATVLERAAFFALERRRRKRAALRQLLDAVREGRPDHAIALSRRSRFFVVKVLGCALEHREHPLDGAVKFAKERELHRYRRGIPILDTVITLAPLLGLLGTVTGMMASFSLIGGELGAPGAITGGIAEALIATAFGLGIAITSLIPFNLMNQRLEDATREIDDAANAMTTLLAHAAASGETGGGVCSGA